MVGDHLMAAPLFRIRAVTLTPAANPAGGRAVLAHLEVVVAGALVVPDVALLHDDDGGLRIGLPRVERGSRLGFHSCDVAQELLKLATEACRKIIGPRDAPATSP